MTLTARRRNDDHKLNNNTGGTSDQKYTKTAGGVTGIVVMVLSGAVLLSLLHAVFQPVKALQQQQAVMMNLCEPVEIWDAKVREIKARVDIFETDAEAQDAAGRLQNATRALLAHVYGVREPYRVVVDLTFPTIALDYKEKGATGQFVIDMAPSALVPHSVYTYLEMARQFQGGAFHRIAHHVLQVRMSRIDTDPKINKNEYPHTVLHLAFQEYNEAFPHKKGTVGYAGRPSGPAWYASIQDNTRNHGPGSQQKHNPHEADALFGTIVEGFDDTILRISKIPGNGFLPDPNHHVVISAMTILVPDSDEQTAASGRVYKEWTPPESMCTGIAAPTADFTKSTY